MSPVDHNNCSRRSAAVNGVLLDGSWHASSDNGNGSIQQAIGLKHPKYIPTRTEIKQLEFISEIIEGNSIFAVKSIFHFLWLHSNLTGNLNEIEFRWKIARDYPNSS